MTEEGGQMSNNRDRYTPTTGGVEAPSEAWHRAFDQGLAAYQLGHGSRSNPHTPGTAWYTGWRDGWHHAHGLAEDDAEARSGA